MGNMNICTKFHGHPSNLSIVDIHMFTSIHIQQCTAKRHPWILNSCAMEVIQDKNAQISTNDIQRDVSTNFYDLNVFSVASSVHFVYTSPESHISCSKNKLRWARAGRTVKSKCERQESDLSQGAHIFGILYIFASWLNPPPPLCNTVQMI